MQADRAMASAVLRLDPEAEHPFDALRGMLTGILTGGVLWLGLLGFVFTLLRRAYLP